MQYGLTFFSSRSLVILALSLFAVQLTAQINFEAGYSYSFTKARAISNQLTEYEASRQNRNGELSKLTGLHGLELAGIYHMDQWSTGLFWSYRRDHSKSAYLSNDGLSELEETLKLTDNIVGISLQSNIDQFSIGNRTGYEFYRLKFQGNTEFPDRQIKLKNGFTTQFFISYEIAGNDNLRIMIRPFYQVNLYRQDLSPLTTALGVADQEGDRKHYFGIALVFTNGQARN